MSEQSESRALDARVAERVMRLDVRGFTYAYQCEGTWTVTNRDNGESWIGDGRGSMQPVYVVAPHWLEDIEPDAELFNGCPILGLEVVPFYSTDPADDYEVLKRVRETWSDEMAGAFADHLERTWHERSGVGPEYERRAVLACVYEPGDYSRAAISVMQ